MILKYAVTSLVILTLSLISMGPLYATSPQKSTIITINGDDVNHPIDCKGDFPCLLRTSGADIIYRHGSDVVTTFKEEDVEIICEVGRKAGKSLTVLRLNDSHTCSQ